MLLSCGLFTSVGEHQGPPGGARQGLALQPLSSSPFPSPPLPSDGAVPRASKGRSSVPKVLATPLGLLSQGPVGPCRGEASLSDLTHGKLTRTYSSGASAREILVPVITLTVFPKVLLSHG